MQLSFDFDAAPSAPLPSPSIAGTARRTSHGRGRHFSGLAAEEQVKAHYERRGAVCLGERVRTPGGELDLVFAEGTVLVFVEVKRRKVLDAWASPVSPAQWRRLEQAAIHYILERQTQTGIRSFCRFDVALAGPDGSIRIVENARSFDA